MTEPSFHGASTRRPVVHGGERIRGLYERTLKSGAVVYDYRIRIDGALRRGKIEHAETRTDAVREFRRLQSDRDYGVERENPLVNPTVDTVLDEWLASLQTRVGIQDDKHRVAQATVDVYTRNARRYVRPHGFGGRRIADVTTADVRRLIDRARARGLAPVSVNIILATISGALEYAYDYGYVGRNVARDLPRSARPGTKRQTEPRYLTYDEVQALLDAASATPTLPLRPVIACCFYAALRISEALGLQWECVDFKADTIDIRQQAAQGAKGIVPYTKTHASKAAVDLSPALRRELLDHRSRQAEINLRRVQPEALVFVGRRGQMLRTGSTLEALKRVATQAGLNPPSLPPIGQHDLRHSAAALALQHGAGPEQAAELLRHSNPLTTMRSYAGLNAEGRGAALRKLLDAGVGV